MDVLLFILGAAVVGLLMVDALTTTVSAGGSGPLTRVLTLGIWRLGLAWHRRHPSHRTLSRLGPVVMLTALLAWVALLWLGYTLIFSSNPGQIVSSQTQQPADLAERIYYTGFTVFTLGVGDFVADSDFYRVLTAIAAINGLFLVTLAITYMVPVLSAVVDKRQLACSIHGLGDTPQQIVLQAWDGQSCASLTTVLHQLAPSIVKHAQRHLAYPVLHYFHSRTRREAFPVQIAALSEALVLLEERVAPDARPDAVAMRSARAAIDTYLDVLHLEASDQERQTPPDLDTTPLSAAGIPLTDSPPDSDAAAPPHDHRAKLSALLTSQGWQWNDVRSPDDAHGDSS